MGAMDKIKPENFTHSFTNELNFVDKFEKFKCFRILDNNGNVEKPEFEKQVSDDLMLKMHEYMIMMNEADQVF